MVGWRAVDVRVLAFDMLGRALNHTTSVTLVYGDRHGMDVRVMRLECLDYYRQSKE